MCGEVVGDLLTASAVGSAEERGDGAAGGWVGGLGRRRRCVCR